MIQLITYSNESMTISADLCRASAKKHGCGYTYNYILGVPKVIREHPAMSGERGAGYWLWKPAIIADMFLYLGDNDILIYSDAGVEFINNVNYIVDRMDEDIFFFSNGHRQAEWCKMDAFIRAGVEPDFEARQVQASVIFMKKTEAVITLVYEWLGLCLIPGLIDDSPSKAPNWPTFAEHRHDQAILTLMQIKYGYKLHWWPTQYSNHIKAGYEHDNYPALFNHHRKRNHEW